MAERMSDRYIRVRVDGGPGQPRVWGAGSTEGRAMVSAPSLMAPPTPSLGLPNRLRLITRGLPTDINLETSV
jgi:hypothetical protein